MLRLMIVDDEKITRDGLIEFTNWQELDVEVVGEAEDGYQALDVFQEVKPDIILCDVRMPRMDGLEFASQIRFLYPYVQIIFLSGYSDKEYLKTAIRLNAIDYIEKPVDEAELISAVKKAIKLYNASKAAELKMNDLQEKLHKSINDIENNLALDLVLEHTDKKDINERLRLIETGIKHNDEFITIIIKLNFNSNDSINNMKSVKHQLLNNIGDTLYDLSENYLFGTVNDGFIIHVSITSKRLYNFESLLMDSMKKLISEIPNAHNFMSVGAGIPVTGIFQIHQSYKSAYSAIKSTFYRGFGTVVFFNDLDNRQYNFKPDLLEIFKAYLIEDKIMQAIELLEDLTITVSRYENTDINYIKNVYVNLFICLHEVLKQKHLLDEEHELEKVNLLRTIYEMPTLMHIKNHIKDKMILLEQSVDKYKTKSRIVYQVEKYILDNYNIDFDLQSIADAVYLSATYLCSVFKRETGKTINQYMLEVKIEKSKEFLRDNSLKIYEVAEKVGFSNQNYFAKVFCKMVGINPSEYREKFL